MSGYDAKTQPQDYSYGTFSKASSHDIVGNAARAVSGGVSRLTDD